MRAPKKKRLVVMLSVTGALLASYFVAYFICVSIEFAESKESTLLLTIARYQPAPISQEFSQSLFEPARVIDATYLRPGRWRDRQERRL